MLSAHLPGMPGDKLDRKIDYKHNSVCSFDVPACPTARACECWGTLMPSDRRGVSGLCDASGQVWHSSLNANLLDHEVLNSYINDTRDACIVMQSIMAGIKRNESALQEAHERSKTVTRSEEMKDIREKMQDDIDEVNKTAHQVKQRLERLDKLNQQALQRPVSLLDAAFKV